MSINPAVAEALTLLFLSVSGVSIAGVLGVRKVFPLVSAGLAGAVVTRLLTAFATWSLGLHAWIYEAWLALAAGLIIWATIQLHQHWRPLLTAIAVMAGLSGVSIWTKYGLAVGERHHSDVSQVLGMAIVVFQAEAADLSSAADNYKRGVAYPLMLALGPDGRILSGFTPLIFLVILLTIAWVAWEMLADRVKARWFVASAAALMSFSLSVPMFRAAMFYLNAHTLMAFGILLMISGVLLARKSGRYGATASTLVFFGGVIGVTSRIEGVLLVLVVLAALASERWWANTTDRIRFFATASITGLMLTWWIGSMKSPVIERIVGGQDSGPILLLITIGSLIGPLVIAMKWFDGFRPFVRPALAALLAILLVAEVINSDEPVQLVMSQWPNLGLGAGGWGTAASAFVGSAVLLGLAQRSEQYRWLLRMSLILIAAVLVSKTFDGGGGFGWGSFYDSVNRMWLHVMPTVALTTLIGYSELLQKAASGNKDPSAPTGQGTTVMPGLREVDSSRGLSRGQS